MSTTGAERTQRKAEDYFAPGEVEKIIRNHVGYSMVAGALPIPLVDIAVITAIHVDMIKQLAAQYGVDFSIEQGRSLATSIAGATFGSILGRAGASILKIVPGIGTLLGIGSRAVLAGATTFSLGRVFQDHFENHGTLNHIDLREMKRNFDRFFKDGKEFARRLRFRQERMSILDTIDKLRSMRDAGTISEDEYETAKTEILNKASS